MTLKSASRSIRATADSETVQSSLNVRFWHLADLDAGAEHVRFGGVKRTSLIGWSMSANDPKRISRGSRIRDYFTTNSRAPSASSLKSSTTILSNLVRPFGHVARTSYEPDKALIPPA